jgi:hypothetical protein
LRTDFNTAPGGILLPADSATGKPGASFFLVTREAPAVVRAAHAYRGAAHGGCSAYPLDKLPLSLSLVVDKVQLHDARGAAVLLHASLAPAQAMGEADFIAALREWQGALPCAIEGSAEGAQDCHYEVGGGGEARAEGSCAEAQALVASAAAQLAALMRPAAAAQPAGGSPGALPSIPQH